MDLWNTETAIAAIDGLDIEIPAWIDADISPYTVASICQGGCASGAYMPAVTYHTALEIMSRLGDDVLDYIEETLGELPTNTNEGISWSGMACFYLSYAVELWAASVEAELEAFEEETTE